MYRNAMQNTYNTTMSLYSVHQVLLINAISIKHISGIFHPSPLAFLQKKNYSMGIACNYTAPLNETLHLNKMLYLTMI